MHVALFHSVLGIREGVLEGADRLRRAGHEVTVIDQYDGRVFDSYDEASEFADALGWGPLMASAVAGVRDLPDDLVVAGFSNGGGMAEYVASQRSVRGLLMFAAAVPPEVIGIETWPHGVDGQIHYTTGDEYREQSEIDAVVASAAASGATIEVFDYPGSGHLFTDRTLAEEFDPESTELLWERVLAFIDALK